MYFGWKLASYVPILNLKICLAQYFKTGSWTAFNLVYYDFDDLFDFCELGFDLIFLGINSSLIIFCSSIIFAGTSILTEGSIFTIF